MSTSFLDSVRTWLPPSPKDASELEAYGHDRTALRPGAPLAVLFPRNTDDVLHIVSAAREFRQPLVPSGGRTGYAGGATAGPGQVVVSMERMNAVLGFDPALPALTVQTGMTTAQVGAEAAKRGLLFPVDFASSGSAQIGGNLATHAGGIRVLHYGTIRQFAAGLTAVTGAGEVLRFPGNILKNNTGYDLKDLLIGSEGTLAIITEATLRLVPLPPDTAVVLVALPDLASVVDCLERLRGRIELYAFEAFDAACLEAVCDHAPDARCPFSPRPPWCVLMEVTCDDADRACAILLESRATEILPATSPAASRSFWALREGISEALGQQGRPIHKNDISLPPHSFGSFVDSVAGSAGVDGMIQRVCPGAASFVFGHVADGNLHLNILAPAGLAEGTFRDAMHRFDEQSYALVARLGGSISAEHGIGLLKRESLHFSRSPAELRLMQEIKRAFDPDGILNPGKLLP